MVRSVGGCRLTPPPREIIDKESVVRSVGERGSQGESRRV